MHTLNKQLSNNYAYFFILVILLIPIFIINKTAYADWGDDYIQYIYQSLHLFDNNFDYKIVLNNQNHAPIKRGVLFSLLISVNRDIYNIINYKNIICVTYLLAALIVYVFYKKYFSNIQSILIVLCVFYNYRSILLKNEIVAEFLFIIIAYSIFILENKQFKNKIIILSLLFASLISVRVAGIIFYVAYIISIIKVAELKNKKHYLIIFKNIACFCIFIFAFNYFLLNKNNNTELTFYNRAVNNSFNIYTFFDNIKFYFKHISLYFEQEVPYFINYVLKFLAFIFIITGIVKYLQKGLNFINTCFILYFVAIFVWPDQGNADRYLMPVLPFLFLYLFFGLKYIIKFFKVNKYFNVVSICFLTLFIFSNTKTIYLINTQKSKIGPFNAILKSDYKTIRLKTKSTDIIAFSKPLVINLFCNRNSISLFIDKDGGKNIKPNYYLVPKNNLLGEVFEISNKQKNIIGDTLFLNYFFLIKTQ